jgi:xanthine dehydrogenase accessory factor
MTNPNQTTSDEALLIMAAKWVLAGHKVALAVVIDTWGSAPRTIGGLMVIRDDGLFEGSVSGGCVEGEVIFEAENTIKSGLIKRLDYSVSNEMAWEAGLACGGNIRILISALSEASLPQVNQISQNIKSQKTTALKIELETGNLTTLSDASIADLPSKISFLIENQKENTFYVIFPAPVHLFIIGAVHISQPLILLAQILNYKVTLIDPRGLFAQKERFWDVELIEDWPDNYLKTKNLTDRSAVVTLTHDPKIDDVALKIALNSKAFYIGSLGSKKTHKSRVERLKAKGFEEEKVNKIYGPIGLNIGSKTPAEIALSIIAEIEACRTGKAQ